MSEELSIDEKFVEKLTEILEVNLQNEQFGVEELAAELVLSRSQLHRKLHAINGKSTSQYIREYRLEKAMDMLQNNVATASEIAYRVGFGSPTYFNTSFREYYGYPPGEVKYQVHSSLEDNGKIQALLSNEKGKRKSKQKVIYISIIAIVLISALFYYLFQSTVNNSFGAFRASHEEVEKSIAVLPFKILSDKKDNQYLADGIMDDILNHLSAIKEFKVISRTSMEQYRGTVKTAPKIAKELKVSYIIESSIQVYSDSIKVIVQLIDAKKDEHIWSNSFKRANKNIFALESEIAQQIATELRVTLSPTQLQQIEKMPTKNIEAYNLYLKGKYFGSKASKEDINNGIKYFKQAIKNDPEFALAYAGLADAIINKNTSGLIYNEELSEAKTLALKAIALDNNSAEAHIVLGILAKRVEWNWEKAENEFKFALSINPNNANAHYHYGNYLRFIKGDFNQSRNQMDQALLLDPLSYITIMRSAKYYLLDGEFEKAFLETSRAQEIDRNNRFSYWVNFENYVTQGMNDKAIDELERSWNMNRESQEQAKTLRIVYNKSGIKGVYKWIIDTEENEGNPAMNNYWLAQKYAFIGENNKALDWLEKAIEIIPFEMWGIKYDPSFYNLHNEPRFLAILKKMGLGDYQ